MGFSSARNLGRDISAGFSPPRRMPISEAVKKFMRVPKGAGNPVIMPENTFMMIHKPFGFTGGDAEDMRTYADLLDKVEAVLLPAYAQKTGKTTDEIAAMLADETWMSGAECLAHGFADQVTPAVKAMACIQSKRTEEFKKMPESIRNMITPPRNSAPRVQDDEPAASRTPVQAAAPVVDENSIRAQVLAEQKARVNGINDLFAMFGGRYQTLQAQCLADPECSLEQAREKLLNEMGRESTPSNKNTPAHIYAGNGNFVGDGIRQALMARAGFEKTERDNVYNGMTLREYARMSLTERGIGVTGLTVAPASASVKVGATTTLTFTVKPDGASDKAISVHSTDPQTATVTLNGLVATVKGVKQGSVSIVGMTSDGDFVAVATVAVSAAG